MSTDATMNGELVDVTDGPRTRLGESPRWDGAAWWWVDASVGEVWTRRPHEPAVSVLRTGERVSLVQPEVSGRVVVASRQELVVLDRQWDGTWKSVGRWSDLGSGDRRLVNDGVADSRGRLWIGSIAPDRRAFGGMLLRVDRDGSVAEAASGFTLTNGMAWGVGEKYLFHVDTCDRTVWAHRVDLSSGEVLGRDSFVDFTEDDGAPDGIATDVDGGVWVAMYGSGQVRRYDAAGGIDTVVEVDPPQCTSVELGGPDGRDLLITTAREGYDDVHSAREPLAGRLYHARSVHTGLPKAKVVVEMEGPG